jgi:pimeloyl-ACP methyl ester carboxylesterase
MTRTRPAVALLVLLLAVGAACSGDDDAAEGEGAAASTEAAAASDDPDGTDDPDGGAGATATGLGDPDGVDPLPPLPDEVALPIVFVHGFAGSAQQYETQAMRFVANGYPAERISAYEHDGAGLDIAAYTEGLAAFVDDVLAEQGAEQVHLVGHSRGTGVSSAYLSDPARAAKVARYVAIDGQPCVEVVPCLEPTQETYPGQAHVETATSAESFADQYEFLVGEAPEVVDVVPQRAPVELTGRAVEFPANTGRAGVDLEVWEVDGATGMRVGDEPVARAVLDDDGGFGPIEVATGAHHEFVLSTDETPVQHHLYLQPYLRSSHLVRLLSSAPDGATRTNTNVGDDHAALIAIRMREWYATDDGDLDGDQRDVLEVGMAGEEPVDVLEPYVGNGTIGLHVHDDAATPGETTLAPLPYFSEQPFQSGIDVSLPADETATITVTNIPRGDADDPQVLNVPAWPSSGHAISVVFSDWAVDGS